MSATAVSLILYILWTLILLIVLIAGRTLLISRGQKEVNSFRPDGADVSDVMQRLTRAHANCVESFPVVAGVLLLALVLNMQHLTDALAYVVIGARIIQSLIHWISGTVLAVQLRFATFMVQIVICGYWLLLMLIALL